MSTRSSPPTRWSLLTGLLLAWAVPTQLRAEEPHDICTEFRQPAADAAPKAAQKRRGVRRPLRPKKSAPEVTPAPAPSAPQPELPLAVRKKLELKQAELKRDLAQMERLSQLGRHGQAARGLSLAYAFVPEPQTLYGAARAYHQADLDDEALILYDRYLREVPQSPHRDEVRGYIGGLCSKRSGEKSRLDHVAQGYVDVGKQHAKDRPVESIAAYATAYGFNRMPLDLFNIGQAYRRSGKAAEAHLIYQRFLDEDPQNRFDLRRETEDHMQGLRKALAMPIYRKGWFWGGVAASVAVAGAVILGASLGARDDRMTLEPRFGALYRR